MRFRVPELFLGMLSTVAILAMGMVFSSQYFPNGIQIKTPHEASDAVNGKSHPAPSSPNVNSTSNQYAATTHQETNEISLLGVRTGEALLVLVTLMLWKATRDLVKGAEDTAKRQLRAYVSVVGCKMKQFEVGRKVVATLTVQNAGQTPAYDTTVVTTIEFRKLPVTSNLILGKPSEYSKTTMGPRQKILPSGVSSKALTDEEYAAISEGRAAIFLHGQVRYRTAFGIKPDTTTDFRFYFDSASLEAADGTMRVATEGNEAT